MSLSLWAALFYIISHRVKLEFHFVVKHFPREISRYAGSIRSPRAVSILRPCNLAVNNACLNNTLKALVPGPKCVPRLYTRSRMRIVRGISSARVCARCFGTPRTRGSRHALAIPRIQRARIMPLSVPLFESKVLLAAVRRFPHPSLCYARMQKG